jgi:hypothetical protein
MLQRSTRQARAAKHAAAAWVTLPCLLLIRRPPRFSMPVEVTNSRTCEAASGASGGEGRWARGRAWAAAAAAPAAGGAPACLRLPAAGRAQALCPQPASQPASPCRSCSPCRRTRARAGRRRSRWTGRGRCPPAPPRRRGGCRPPAGWEGRTQGSQPGSTRSAETKGAGAATACWLRLPAGGPGGWRGEARRGMRRPGASWSRQQRTWKMPMQTPMRSSLRGDGAGRSL